MMCYQMYDSYSTYNKHPKIMDPQTLQFYKDMGYPEEKIKKAHQYSQRSGTDILDALNLPQIPSNISQPPPVVQPRGPPPEPLLSQAQNNGSFLTPLGHIKQSQYEILFSRSNKHLHSNTKIQLRQEDYPVGLLNVSNCCYLNSLLQCYFLMDAFKIAILTAQQLSNLEEILGNESKTRVKRIKSEYELLKQFKSFFTTMALTSKRYLDPTSVLQNLVDSVGQKVSYGQQKDLSQINILIIERISEGLMYTKNHYQSIHQKSINNQKKEGSAIIQTQQRSIYNSIFNPRQGAIKKLFYGSRVQYYDDESLQKQPPIVSDFTGLFLNPRGGNLYKSLDDQFTFEVQLNGVLHKKTAFIRDEPQYLFIYINRTDYDKEQGQALKNKQKFTFDFTVYLDRYLEKYRQEHGHSHQKIKELLNMKNKLKEQINHLKILFKKVQECQFYAQELQGWVDKLPKEQEFEEEYDRLEQKLEEIQKELDQIESRKEKYHLLYIFVHRGDAVSGHYWGYGLNGQQWYRFDINTQPIEQDQIIIDLQKSSATPYALLYVKQKNLPNFDYKIYQDLNCLKELKEKDFRSSIDNKMGAEVIRQNISLHNELTIRQNKVMKDKVFTDYITRFNTLKKIGLRYSQIRQKEKRIGQLQIFNNFSLFLLSRAEKEFCKYTLFEQAVFNASGGKYTIQKLLHQSELLHKIQKKFKKSCQGDTNLRFYSLLHKDIEKMTQLYQQYQLGRFEIIWGAIILNQAQFYQDQWKVEVNSHKEHPFEPSSSIKNRLERLFKVISIRNSLLKHEDFKKAEKSLPQPLFISQINAQITKLLMFSIVTTGFKVDSLQQFIEVSDKVGAQIAKINAGNCYSIQWKPENKASPLQQAINLVARFNLMAGSKNVQRKSIKRDSSKLPEQKSMNSSGFKNSFLSPNKINASRRKSLTKDETTEGKLLSELPQVLVLQTNQSWKVQSLDSIKINDDFGSKLLNFLKKLDPLSKVYKQLLKEDKIMSRTELQAAEIFINQPKQEEESLI